MPSYLIASLEPTGFVIALKFCEVAKQISTTLLTSASFYLHAVLGFRSDIILFDNVMDMIPRAISGQTVQISKHQQRTNSRRKENMWSLMREMQAMRGKKFIGASLKCLPATATSKLFPFHSYNNIREQKGAQPPLHPSIVVRLL